MKIIIGGMFVLSLAACTSARSPQTEAVPNLHGKCDVVRPYDIDFNRFDETAQQIAHATGCFIITDTAQTGAVKPQPVRGRYSARQAVAQAIQGTSLKVTRQAPDTITVQ